MPKSPQGTQKPATSGAAGTLSAGERAALKQRTTELKAEARRGSAQENAAFDAEAVAVKIAQMPQPDRAMAGRLHSIVCEASPELQPKLYYGQPGWAKGGKVVVFFRSGLGDKTRYSTLGFSPEAALDDDGGLWPTSYALNHLTDASAALIADLVTRAAR